MWNRVLLLVSGFAFGWILVSYLTVPPSQKRARLIWLATSLGAGGVVVTLMALAALSSGVAGVLAFLFSALVAYAGNARQVNKAAEHSPLNRPERPLHKDARIAVLLIAEGEPAKYDGPASWAQRFLELAASGERVPHWLTRPLAYARIRAAYQAMRDRNPLNSTLACLARQLGGLLGQGYLVADAYLEAAPTLAQMLVHMATEGLSRVVLVPASVDHASPRERLRAEVTRSRVREIGVDVVYAPPLDPAVWSGGSRAKRLRQLTRGMAVAPATEATPQALEALRGQILTAASSWTMSHPATEPSALEQKW
jgi:hypothetical protein